MFRILRFIKPSAILPPTKTLLTRSILPSQAFLPYFRRFSSFHSGIPKSNLSYTRPLNQTLSIPDLKADNEFYKEVVSNLNPDLLKENKEVIHGLIDKYTSSEYPPGLTEEEAINMIVILFEAGLEISERKNLLKALQYYSDCLHLTEKYEAKRGIPQAIIQSSIGYIYLQLQALDKAEEHYNKATALFDSESSANISEESKLVHKFNVGLLRDAQGKLEEAINLLEQVTPNVHKLAPRKQFMIQYYGNLGSMYRKKSDLGNAVAAWKKGVEFVVENLGEDSKETNKFYRNIALALKTINRFPEALPYAEKWLRQTINNPEEGDDLGEIYVRSLITEIYILQRDIKKAKEAASQLEKVLESSPKANSAELTSAYLCIAIVYSQQNQTQEAQKWINKALEVANGASRQNVSSVAGALDSWALLLAPEPNTRPYAKELCLKAESLYKQFGISGTLAVCNLRNTLGMIAIYDENTEDAIKYMKECLALYDSNRASPMQIEKMNYLLGFLHMKAGKYEEAVKYQKEAIRICESMNNVTKGLGNYYYLLGENYVVNSLLDEALDAFNKAVGFTLPEHGKDNEIVQASLNGILGILENQGKLDEVEKIKKLYGIEE